jgi:hypothetical protein
LLTTNGAPSKAEKNIAVAIQQGRTTPEEAQSWRDAYVERGYESVTRELVKTKVGRVSPAGWSATILGEAAEQDYLRRTGAVRDFGGYRAGW